MSGCLSEWHETSSILIELLSGSGSVWKLFEAVDVWSHWREKLDTLGCGLRSSISGFAGGLLSFLWVIGEPICSSEKLDLKVSCWLEDELRGEGLKLCSVNDGAGEAACRRESRGDMVGFPAGGGGGFFFGATPFELIFWAVGAQLALRVLSWAGDAGEMDALAVGGLKGVWLFLNEVPFTGAVGAGENVAWDDTGIGLNAGAWKVEVEGVLECLCAFEFAWNDVEFSVWALQMLKWWSFDNSITNCKLCLEDYCEVREYSLSSMMGRAC